MMLQWMAYAALCAALFAAAAACVERVCASHGRARRGVWLAAIALSVIVPASLPWTARGISVAVPVVMANTPLDNAASATRQLPQADIVALTAWATASLLFAALLLLAHWRTSRVLRGCRRGMIAGRPAFISHDFGPAVVGVFRHHIVVPDWVLGLEENEQQLVVMHELEHARSSDPLLALAGVCSVVAMPWNVALWWQLSRLRLAIEVDCDARVVARKAESNVIAYGQLLLCVRERGRANRHPVLALTHSRSSLAKRLDALLDRRTHRRPAQLAGLATLALCIAASVAFIPAPHVESVLAQLRTTHRGTVGTRASPAGVLTRQASSAPAIGPVATLAAVRSLTPAINQRRTSASRGPARSNARVDGLAETPVPPMSVVSSNPLGLIAPATASRVLLNSPRAMMTRGAVARSGGGGGAVRAAPSAAVGRAGGGFAAAAGRGGVQPVLTEVPVDSARGVVRPAARAPVAARPDTTRPPR